MHLITEANFDGLEILTENTESGKHLYIEGIFAQAEKKNRNGRIYPDVVLSNEIKRFVNEMVKTNRALGELEHPDHPHVNPDRASHLITEINKSGTNYIGKAKILETPCGQIVKGIVEGGATLGVSTRGVGTVSSHKGSKMVNEDFHLQTVDIVTNPSGIDCFVNGIMEGVEWALDAGGVYKQKSRQSAYKKTQKMLSERQRLSKVLEFVNSIKE